MGNEISSYQVSKKKIIDFKGKKPSRKDYDQLITDDCIIYPEGNNPIIQLNVKEYLPDNLVQALRSLNYNKSIRQSGLESPGQRLILKQPRDHRNGNVCTSSSVASDNPEAHKIFESLLNPIERVIAGLLPKHTKVQRLMLSKIHPAYTANNMFTSGIINENSALAYHHDSANLDTTFSCMLVKKHGISGGYLCLPEYGIALGCPDNSLVIFDGKKILHGVTPITKAFPDAFRYSIVYFVPEKMKYCLEPEEEILLAQKKMK